jgi:hypothetical protein
LGNKHTHKKSGSAFITEKRFALRRVLKGEIIFFYKRNPRLICHVSTIPTT